MKHPTLRKLRARGLVAVRYHAPPPHSEFRHGWLLGELPGGGLRLKLVGEDRPRRLNAGEARYVKAINREERP
jgi:hypothetical protein